MNIFSRDRFSNAADHHPAAPPHPHRSGDPGRRPADLGFSSPSVPLSGQRLHHHAYHAAHLRPDPGALFCHVPGNRAAYQRRFRRNDPRPAALICQRKIYTGHYASFFSACCLRWAAHVFLRPSSKRPAAIQTLPKNIKPPSISGSGISLNFPVPSYPA